MRRALFVVAVAVPLVLAGCGRGSDRAAAAPPRLPSATVPTSLAVGGGLVVQPNLSKKTAKAFESVGSASLVVEAGVWELRKADRLVGALELVTLDNRRIDLARDEDRAAIRSQVLAGDPSELEVAGIPVWSSVDGDRVLYVWYGRQVLGVLQVKADEIDPEEAIEELVTAMIDADGWPELDPEVFEEDDQ